MKLAVRSADEGSVRRAALLRASLALLYAHYEGYCRYALDLYTSTIQKQGPIRGECLRELAILSLREEFGHLKHAADHQEIWMFCTDRLEALLNEPIVFPSEKVRHQNLWPGYLAERASTMGLPTAEIDQHRTVLRSLVTRRNDIAHGRQADVKSIEDYQTYESAAFDVMYALTISIVTALDAQSYRLSAASSRDRQDTP